MIPAILQNSSSARIIVVTDPKDKVVPRKNQSDFVERFREAGGRIEQFYVEFDEQEASWRLLYATFVIKQCIEHGSHRKSGANWSGSSNSGSSKRNDD